MIAVIDYEAGNPHSVANALSYLGYSAQLVNRSSDLKGKKLFILPGVGSASATRKSLTELGLWESLPDFVLNQRVPFLGICVGMQILFDHSEEDDTPGWGWIPGEVKRYDSTKVRVPQMGWNALEMNPEHPLCGKFATEHLLYFYFVNSYYALPKNSSDILGTTDYGGQFCAFVNRDHIFATQFHIEKSSQDGMHLFKKILDHLCINPKK